MSPTSYGRLIDVETTSCVCLDCYFVMAVTVIRFAECYLRFDIDKYTVLFGLEFSCDICVTKHRREVKLFKNRLFKMHLCKLEKF